MKPRLWGAGVALLAFSACTSPHRVQTMVSPSLDACRYKMYQFTEPEDRTLTKWLSDPLHRKSLEDLLREALAVRGLREVPSGGASPDLFVRQMLETRIHPSRETSGGAAEAGLKDATWTVSLSEGATTHPLWSSQMDAVIGEMVDKNLSNAREGLREAFSGYPKCRK